MTARASSPRRSSAAADAGPLPSAADLASDGTARLAPIGAIWNDAALRDAYHQIARAAVAQNFGSAAFDAATDVMKRLWAADFAFQPSGAPR